MRSAHVRHPRRVRGRRRRRERRSWRRRRYGRERGSRRYRRERRSWRYGRERRSRHRRERGSRHRRERGSRRRDSDNLAGGLGERRSCGGPRWRLRRVSREPTCLLRLSQRSGRVFRSAGCVPVDLRLCLGGCPTAPPAVLARLTASRAQITAADRARRRRTSGSGAGGVGGRAAGALGDFEAPGASEVRATSSSSAPSTKSKVRR